MSDYYGGAKLEDWLAEEVFTEFVFTKERPIPVEVTKLFEQWRADIQNNIFAWMESDDGYGNTLSWRGWGRGFYAIPDNQTSTFDRAVREGRLYLTKVGFPTEQIRGTA